MRLVDIRNSAVATIDSCDKEPIHIPGAVQPWGYLLATARPHGPATHCSANIAQLLGLPPEKVLGRPLSDFFASQYGVIAAFLEAPHNPDETLLLAHLEGYLHVGVHSLPGGGHVFEFEPVGDLANPAFVPISEVNRLLNMSQHPEGVQSLCQSVADYVKQKLGYDRVFVYRFHEDLSGEVVAESREDEMEPYLGLRYPASDIPPQARALYLQNLLRVIADVGYEPVPLLTHEEVDPEHRQLDLSQAVLRSVSPIHLQYLRNMQVGATTTISILNDGRLWGMLSCHHRTPRLLSPTQRQTGRLCGLMLSAQLEVHQRAESLKLVGETDRLMERLLREFQKPGWQLDTFVQQEALRTICGATGVVIRVNDMLYQAGLVPPPDALYDLTVHLKPALGNSLVTRTVADLVPDFAALAHTAAGAVYQSLGRNLDCIIWLRPGLAHTVRWAGDPHSTVSRDAVTNQLMPRTSFAAWQQTVRHMSDAWHPYQTNAGGLLASALEKHMHLLALRQQEEKQRLLAEQLKATNEELENINWISIHDLREPLRKIQALISRIMTDEGVTMDETVSDTLQRIERSAGKMQTLLNNVMEYARLSGPEEAKEVVDLRVLVHEIAHEYADDAAAADATMQVDALPAVTGIRFQFKQLFENLVGNALKFSRPGVPPVIRISFRPEAAPPVHAPLDGEEAFFCVAITDNGRGFPDEYKDRIFKLFQRLDASVQGSGVGLSICKKVMDNHDGWIEVESQPGHGTTFRLYFPQNRLAR